MTQRDGMGREVGAGFRMANTCTPMADSCQCMAKTNTICKVISLQKRKKWCFLFPDKWGNRDWFYPHVPNNNRTNCQTMVFTM